MVSKIGRTGVNTGMRGIVIEHILYVTPRRFVLREKIDRIRIGISIESLVLMFICTADMLSTLYFVSTGRATEQNPIMAACINHSSAMFVLVKILSFIPFVIAVELYRKKNPEFARKICIAAIALYVAIFTILTVAINV